MTVVFIRVLFVLLSTVLGYQILPVFFQRPEAGFVGAAGGAAFAAIMILVEMNLARVSLGGLSAAVFGLLLALMVSKFVIDAVDLVRMDAAVSAALKLAMIVILSYLGMVLAIRGRDEFRIIIPYVKFQRQNQAEAFVILDTSVIIDGRVADLLRTRFVEGHFIVPKFVLNELQTLADSSDALKRAKGRRGLDILSQLQKDPKASLKINEQDFPEIKEVDAKIVKLAKLLDARVLTNDYNLNKVAELEGVTILSLHELAAALKPVLLAGERISVNLLREGRERDQAVAYLEDGTMVVVERARQHVGETLGVTVTSVLQTNAGRMVFAKLESER